MYFIKVDEACGDKVQAVSATNSQASEEQQPTSSARLQAAEMLSRKL